MTSETRSRSLLVVLAAASVASAQVDSMQVLVTQTTATGAQSGLIFASAYDPLSDTAWVSVVSAVDLTARIRKITSVSTTPTTTNMIAASELDTWLRQGDATRQNGGLPQGLSFNPAAVGSIGAYGALWLSDTASITLPGLPTNDPVASQRLYRYNLQAVPTSGATVYDNVGQVLSALINKADKQTAAGQTPSTGSDGSGRQAAFSPDGKFLYLQDSSTTIPGIYRVDPINPQNVVRVTSATASSFSENGVVKAGSLDRIYFKSSNAPGALTYVDHDPTNNTTSAEVVAVSTAAFQSFLENASTPSVSAVAGDAAGNVYFSDSNSGITLKLDTAGRLMKITSRAERASILGVPAPSASTVKMQAYAYAHPTAGSITRVAYNEQVYGLGVINVFKPSDFDRDGDEDQVDRDAFLAKLGTRGQASALADARYDLNGNGVIDWKDVKILQTFATTLQDGDANLDGALDLDDLNILRDNYLGSGKTWASGDFASLVAGSDVYLASAADANVTNYVDLQTLADAWLNVLGQPAPTFAQLDANGYTGQFRDDVITAFNIIPEPSTLGVLGAGAMALARRRRR